MDSASFQPSVFIYAIVCLMIFHSPTFTIDGNETDRLSLLEFKAKIADDPLGVMSSWNNTINFCQWYGVSCGQRHQRVTALDLRSLKLAGSISPHIGNLSFLRTLLLQNNSFSDEIPQEIGRLRRLQEIRLSNNSFTGEIPSNLSSCSNLSVFDLGNNKLVGKVPSEFVSLLRLQSIDIRSNSLSGGIPPFFGNFSSLQKLAACSNGFSGSTIPPLLYNISSIAVFYVDRNKIQGTLPTDFGITLPNLELFNVAANQFTGSIPVSFYNATNLLRFFALRNKLTGKVPNLDNLHKLQWLSISMNHLGSDEDDLSFLSSLENATSFQLLAINDNNFQGFLPQSIGNLSITLKILSLSWNQISGAIPASIQNLVNLELLYLNENTFTGIIPREIGMLKKLNHLLLDSNQFSGNIPSSIGNLSLLTQLGLSHNLFQGHIPSSIGECQSLLLLDLSNNNLTGSIPTEVFGLSSLSIYLDLSSNSLNSSLPNEVGNLKNLGGLYVFSNMLFGEIPGSLGSCVRLETLMMQENFFQGAIPSALSSLRGLQILDLSSNNLTGQLPAYLENFNSLTELNLSFNNFGGMVSVKGVFRNASATSVMGNSKLCGGIREFHLPMCPVNESNNSRFSHIAKLIVIIISGFLGVSSVLFSLYVLLVWKKTQEARASSFLGTLQVSYQSLLKATDGFSSTKLIGIGSFGSVYQGIDENGTKIAVKVLNLLRRGASNSFMAECEALRNIRHRNLVKLLTVCSGIDYQGDEFKALVYEFMANGSLEEWLHPADGAPDQAPKTLNFLQRLNLATDVACALDYLHHQCETTIVHCDLKPSNVLLDQDMTAHLGDFGLARFLQEPSNAGQTNSIGVRGTVGYAAPEYGMGSDISTGGDVYSYGILLLEMFTMKRPTDDLFKEGLDLHKFAGIDLTERVADIADTILLQEVFTMEKRRGQTVHEALISIMEIGISCSGEFPQERMNMSDVAARLNSIRSKFV